MTSGIVIAILEFTLFFFISSKIRHKLPNLISINTISYYWLMMTILTFIWEISFICNYDNVYKTSTNFLKNKEHVWTNNYSLYYILPNKLAEIYYAEYAAYADKEYMTFTNDWSRVIESTHAIFCGLFSLMAILCKIRNVHHNYLISIGIGMGSQFMNSILYMANYFIQIKDPNNINYNTPEFPCGPLLLKRPFMWVNLLWSLMPAYVIYNSLTSVPSLRK